MGKIPKITPEIKKIFRETNLWSIENEIDKLTSPIDEGAIGRCQHGIMDKGLFYVIQGATADVYESVRYIRREKHVYKWTIDAIEKIPNGTIRMILKRNDHIT